MRFKKNQKLIELILNVSAFSKIKKNTTKKPRLFDCRDSPNNMPTNMNHKEILQIRINIISYPIRVFRSSFRPIPMVSYHVSM